MMIRQNGCAPKTFYRMARATVLSFADFAAVVSPASALVPQAGNSLQQQLKQDSSITEVVVVRRGGVASRTVVRRGAVVRPGVAGAAVVRPGVVRLGAWVRPSRYYWPVGGAIAAGAAIGFVTAATAAAWAGAPPVAGSCWYYTDASRTQGFWDTCPQ
jgi:hypothetical protein